MQSEGGARPDPGEGEALLRAIRELVTDVGREPAGRLVGLDARLEADLGLDSLSVAELLVRTEELFGVTLPDATLSTVGTPRDLLTAVAIAGGSDAWPVDVSPRASSGASPGQDPGGRASVGAGTAPPRSGGRAAAVVHGLWSLGVFGVVVAVVGPLLVVTPSLRLRWRLVRGAGRLLATLVGVRVRVEGAHHLPRDQPFVLVANHASHIDPLVLLRLLEEPVVFAAVAELADNPLLRLGLRRMDTLLVGRGDRVRGIADAQALTDTVRGGRSVALFPEGRRAPSPGLERFRMGAFVVAARTGAPVVPVALQGTRALLPVGRVLPRRAEVVVTVVPPITARGTGWQGAVDLQRETRRLILQHSHEPDLS